MGLFKKKEVREEQMVDETSVDAELLTALVGGADIDRNSVMNIPAVAACTNRISDTVASLQVKLYRMNDGQVEEVQNDKRVYLLNDETGDTLDGSQFKKALVTDMLLSKGGYAYIHRDGNNVKSLHYIEAEKVAFQHNTDPIFKDYRINVNGKSYEGWQFIKVLRNTTNGYSGRSIIQESPELMNIVFSSQQYEKTLVKTGGNKKGFIQATSKLTKDAMTALKNAFRNLYSNNTENVVVLNDGLQFKESSNTSVEMQLNENKETNNNDICKIMLVPPTIINGGATQEDKDQYHEGCILPILERFEKALNSTLLLEEEKGELFFAFDVSDLLKADIEKRYKAYEIACKQGFMQIDEVRAKEKLPAFGLEFIKLGLQDVLYNPKTNIIYTPNTGESAVMGEKGGERLDESGDQE